MDMFLHKNKDLTRQSCRFTLRIEILILKVDNYQVKKSVIIVIHYML